MKIQCDVCNRDEASVFCSADEAALCDTCDHRVHHANKLAGKHHRFSLLRPSPKQFPLCDICKEKRAFLFCQQDRAILCRDCDIPIHKANEHTKNHSRFLLTGVKLSAVSSLYSPASPSSSSSANASATTTTTTTTMGGCDLVPNLKSDHSFVNQPISLPSTILNPPSTVSPITDKIGVGSTSSISEYLIETLPGWHVEDFLDSSPAPFGFCKTVDDDVLRFWDTDLEGNLSSSLSTQKIGIWVPQAPPSFQNSSSQFNSSSNFEIVEQTGFESKESTNTKSSRKWRDETCFTVPQITTSSKRSRTVFQ
ncbi:B-box zinc finger protein 21-like [Cornus florida]|uniref:B-box zinc finger protein 21-like n=1 Tax=Cornus florida TaxID=4283 RepID=UPI00289812C2|nr:B-box zinc finger protein 21-like [Cornus florida]